MNSKIEIFYDPYQMMSNEITNEVFDCIEQYVDCYCLIQSAIYNDKDLIIIIREPLIYNAIIKLREKYITKNIKLTIFSFELEFEEETQIIFPSDINISIIKKSNFHTKYKNMKWNKALSFEDNILLNEFDKKWLYDDFSKSKILFYIEDYMKIKEEEDIYLKEFVLSAILKKLNKWSAKKDEIYSKVVSKMIKEPLATYFDIIKAEISQRYYIGVFKSEKDILNYVKEYQIDLSTTLVHNENLNYIKEPIINYLKENYLTCLDEKEFKYKIEHFLGLFSFEFDCFNLFLENNKKLLKNQMVEFIFEKFGNKVRVSSLAKKVEVKKPSYFNENVNTEDVLKWCLKEYFPYVYNNENEENGNKEYRDTFSNWVVKNYSDLIFHSQDIIYKIFSNHQDLLLKPKLSFVIIIDNFGYKYVDFAIKKMNEYDFKNTINKPYFATLPTETNISKKSLFSGKLLDDKNARNEKILSEQLQNYFEYEGKKLKYIPNYGYLEKMDKKNEDVYFLNFTITDMRQHENNNISSFDTDEHVKMEIEKLLQTVHSFILSNDLLDETSIFITSDHGSVSLKSDNVTLIAESVKNFTDSNSELSHRFITINDEEFNTAKSDPNVLFYCFPVSKNIYGLKRNYLVAKSNFTFKKSNFSNYIHGGITPEEMIIPFLEFKKK